MRLTYPLAALLLVAGAPALASTINASLIPDGTYTVKVEKVADPKHMLVKMDNGIETTLATSRVNVNFSTLAANDTVKLSIAKGNVLVFSKQ